MAKTIFINGLNLKWKFCIHLPHIQILYHTKLFCRNTVHVPIYHIEYFSMVKISFWLLLRSSKKKKKNEAHENNTCIHKSNQKSTMLMNKRLNLFRLFFRALRKLYHKLCIFLLKRSKEHKKNMTQFVSREINENETEI